MLKGVLVLPMRAHILAMLVFVVVRFPSSTLSSAFQILNTSLRPYDELNGSLVYAILARDLAHSGFLVEHAVSDAVMVLCGDLDVAVLLAWQFWVFYLHD